MVIGFLGKGGSGKSTLSYFYAQHMKQQSQDVLAIDADHNMDLAYRFGDVEQMAHYGSSMEYLRECIGLEAEENYKAAFTLQPEPVFRFGEDADTFTKKFATKVSDGTLVMTPGPHTPEVVLGRWCSHSLFTALKVYLAFLQLAPNQVVVVDEKAGADGADIGTSSSFDVSVIVSEPTAYGVKTARQIAKILDKFNAPYVFVGNKVFDDEDTAFLMNELGELATYFVHSKHMARSTHDDTDQKNARAIAQLEKAIRVKQPSKSRLERTKEKLLTQQLASL